MDKSQADMLRYLLKRYSYEYYIKGSSSVSDAEYDGLFKMLQDYERQHPDDVPADSPTQRVGSPPEKPDK